MKRHVLIVTCEMLPLPGKPICGGGLRVYGLGEGLRSHGHRVTYSLPIELVEQNPDLPDAIKRVAHTPESLNRMIVDMGPDVVLFEQWGLASYLEDVKVPVVIDLHGSLALENSFKLQSNFTTDALTKLETLRKADLLICPGRMQQTYFLSWFLLAGADPRTAQVMVVPLGMNPSLPKRRKRAKDSGPRFVYGGVNWPWIDPRPGLAILADRIAKSKDASLELFVGEAPIAYDHPLYRNNQGIFTDVGSEFADGKSVILRGIVDHDELIKSYVGADAAFDLYQSNNERQLAVTTRTVEYLWCGLPVIYGDYADLAAPIAQYDAGWIMDPNDEAALGRALDEIFTDPSIASAKSANAQALVADRFTWVKTVAPLARWVASPRRRKPSASVIDGFKEYIRSESLGKIREREEELVALHKEIRQLSAKSQSDVLDKSRAIEQLNVQLRDLSIEHDKRVRDLTRSHAKEMEAAKRESKKALEKLDKEISRRDDSLAKLQEQISTLAREHEERLGALRDGFEAEKRGFEKRLNELAEAKAAEIERIKARHEAELAKLQGQSDQAKAEAAKIQKELSEEIRSLNREREAARLAYEERLVQLAAQRDIEVRELKAAHEVEVARLTDQLERLRERLEQESALHQDEVKQLTRERDERLRGLEAQLEAKDLRHEQVSAEATRKAAAENEALRKEAERLRDRLEQASALHQDEIKQLTRERDERLRGLEAQLEAKDLRHEKALTESARKSSQEIERLAGLLDRARERLEVADRERAQELSSLRQRHEAAIEERDRAVARMREEMELVTRQSQEQRGRLEAKDILLREQTERADRESERVLDLGRELDALRHAHEVVQAAHAELSAGSRAKVEALEGLLAERVGMLDDLDAKLAGLDQAMAMQRDEIAARQAQVDRLEKLLAARDRQIAEANMALDVARSDLAKRATEVRDLSIAFKNVRSDAEVSRRLLEDRKRRPGGRRRRRAGRKAARIFRDLPRLAWLWTVNLATNFYMDKWQRRTGRRIFPGNEKADKG